MNLNETILIHEWLQPEAQVFNGKYCRLEPLQLKHADGLFAVCSVPDARSRYKFLFSRPPTQRQVFDRWLLSFINKNDSLAFAVVDKTSDTVGGKQQLMRIDKHHGVAEIGSILWGPSIARTRIATEAFYLMANYVFDDLKYRRLEWSCYADNEASKRAAFRFGFRFEGVLRHELVRDGKSSDTAWYSILDHEWPTLKPSFEEWLAESNFDESGVQKCSLQSLRKQF